MEKYVALQQSMSASSGNSCRSNFVHEITCAVFCTNFALNIILKPLNFYLTNKIFSCFRLLNSEIFIYFYYVSSNQSDRWRVEQVGNRTLLLETIAFHLDTSIHFCQNYILKYISCLDFILRIINNGKNNNIGMYC
jgi:hypothetical protein